MIVICKECGEYMDYTGEGVDSQQRLYELYLCVECGHETAVPQTKSGGTNPSYFPWDPPDGIRSGA